MPPLRATLAEPKPGSCSEPEEIVRLLGAFLENNPGGAALEGGKTLFEFTSSEARVSLEGGRCTLHLWDGTRQVVRHVESVASRAGTLRLTTRRFGHAAPQILVLAQHLERREPARREPSRQAYLRLLERALARDMPEWRPEAFRVAMDLEHSFGPAFARGLQVRGNDVWVVIGVSGGESQSVIDSILAPGILWLHHCRERGDGRRRIRGLRLVVPPGKGELTLARLPWLHTGAEWQLLELDERTEALAMRDPADCGNLRTRLVHHPDLRSAQDRFGQAIGAVTALVPQGEAGRIEHRLRSPVELAFLLHGLEFARARALLVPGTFGYHLELTVGMGAEATVLTSASEERLRAHVAELFDRRNPRALAPARRLRPFAPGHGIGAFTGRPAHTRAPHFSGSPEAARGLARLDVREKALAAQADPLFRAQPERWLESALRENLAPLTRSLAPPPVASRTVRDRFADDENPDTRGNRSDAVVPAVTPRSMTAEPLISRFDPRYVYTQVPAIAGASDRGMLDLLGVTEDGRLAVIELKASDDLQLPLQGLDYWIRVRHHHVAGGPTTLRACDGGSELQRYGYFCEVALSPLPPRLFLVAPALHIHPATEIILRYLSPRVEWSLLALDERWRQEIRVLWRKSGGQSTP